MSTQCGCRTFVFLTVCACCCTNPNIRERPCVAWWPLWTVSSPCALLQPTSDVKGFIDPDKFSIVLLTCVCWMMHWCENSMPLITPRSSYSSLLWLCDDLKIMTCFVLSVFIFHESILLLSVKGLNSNQPLCSLLKRGNVFCFLIVWLAECVIFHLDRIYRPPCIFGTT